MSANTKIVVLRMKQLIFSAILAVLGILLVILLFVLFFPKNNSDKGETAPTMTYAPGVYTSSVMLGDSAIDVQVIVDENNINSISLVNLDETVETMYPLVKPALAELSQQIIASQSFENISYSESNQYTSIVLLNAIQDAVKKAALE